MTRRRRRVGWLGWIAITLGLVALALGGFYLWASRTGSVAALDWADSFFTKSRHRIHATYGTDPAQQLFVYPNKAAENLPVLVFIHGGSWEHGNPADYGFVARNFAPKGYVVVLAGYRLGPNGRFPAMLEDTASAVAWVHAHIAEHGGDPERILLVGHSAGAYNAAMVALDRQWLGREGLDTGIIKGVVGLAGPYDFYPFDTEAAHEALGHWPRPAETQPVTYARKDAPPMLLASGTADTVVRPRNSVALARALTDAGAPTEPAIFDGVGHGGILLELARPFDADPRIKDAVLAFLAQRSKPAPASAPVQPANR
ncbi:MAG: carboxylesterase family protein [Proteobacteria bacterium]|nr:carboxylesterase family protein [Pseudomonadota bacterium]